MDEEVQPAELESRVYKNHYTIVVQSILSQLITIGIVTMVGLFSGNGMDFRSTWLMVMFVIGAISVFVTIRIWMKTTYNFGPTEITVVRDTMFKNKVSIQYSRLASVNVKKTLVNHIFGTTMLLFNVNSSVNSASAEATLTLPDTEANRLREIVSARIFQKEMVVEDEKNEETLVKVSNMDVILHGFFGQPTSSSLIGLASLTYSIVTMFIGEGVSIIGLLIFGISSIVPWIRTILRYYNYRIYRVGETITVESGLINKYRSSFNINKVNSVRIREPLLARLLGKSLLEAEVVGLADTEGLPLLCPLKGKDIVDGLAGKLVPEFVFESGHHTQPKQSFIPTISNRIFWSLAFMIAGGVLFLYICANHPLDSWNDLDRYAIIVIETILVVIVPLLFIIHGYLAHNNREFEMGEETFMLITGGYDRQKEYIRYDKTQIFRVSSGIIQRRFGVGRCNVSLMSSKGATAINSGIFPIDELERVGAEVMDRIRDGRYDYRKYQ